MIRLDWMFLGRLDYQTALRLQYQHARNVAAGAGPMLFLLEHPPVVTLGRNADVSHLKLSEKEYARRGIEVHRVKRGGDVTYHGPGQLVGYPVASLDSASCSVPGWVSGHAEAIVRFLARYEIKSEYSERRPGVWAGQGKVAALGFHIFRKVSTHGFALNLDPDLSRFNMIVPCGLEQGSVTSMRALGAFVPSMQAAAAQLAGLVAEAFGWSLGVALDAERVLNAFEDLSPIYAAG